MPVPPYGWISSSVKGGNVVPFLGAGASVIGLVHGVAWTYPGESRLPTGDELRVDLTRLTSLPIDETNGADLAAVAQYCSTLVGRPDLLRRLHTIFSREIGRAHV